MSELKDRAVTMWQHVGQLTRTKALVRALAINHPNVYDSANALADDINKEIEVSRREYNEFKTYYLSIHPDHRLNTLHKPRSYHASY